MRTSFPLLSILLACSLVACGASEAAHLPLSERAFDEGNPTLVWLGRGEAEMLVDGAWIRSPAFDYDFSVVQRRYLDRWESVKEMHRRHPDYDGSAGERDQTYHFLVILPSSASGAGPFSYAVRSSLGDGEGSTDAEFRHSVINLRANVSTMAPFDSYRITQDYRYEEAALDEVVELYRSGPTETPWVRNTEHAVLYAVHAFDDPPTRLTTEE